MVRGAILSIKVTKQHAAGENFWNSSNKHGSAAAGSGSELRRRILRYLRSMYPYKHFWQQRTVFRSFFWQPENLHFLRNLLFAKTTVHTHLFIFMYHMPIRLCRSKTYVMIMIVQGRIVARIFGQGEGHERSEYVPRPLQAKNVGLFKFLVRVKLKPNYINKHPMQSKESHHHSYPIPCGELSNI